MQQVMRICLCKTQNFVIDRLLKAGRRMRMNQPKEEGGGSEGEPDAPDSPSRPTSLNKITVKYRIDLHKESEDLLEQAINIYKEKVSIKKAIKFLVSKNFMADSPQEVAIFLRVYKNHFDQTAIGDFLGEEGLGEEKKYWDQIRFRYIRAVSFADMELEPALRLFLTGCGFRLPGEAQKVDRLTEVFTKAFWQDNHGTPNCPFRVQDTVFLLSFAIIMLNTDLHRNQNKKVKKMTKEQFLSNLRDADAGHKIDPEYLIRIYDSIAAKAIALAFDSSEANPIPSSAASSIFGGGNKDKIAAEEQERFLIQEVTKGLRDSEDLLRALSPFTHHFLMRGIDTNLSLDLISFMCETAWPYFRDITKSLLLNHSMSNNAQLAVTLPALDITCSVLTSAIFLNKKEVAKELATELTQFIEFCDKLDTHDGKVHTSSAWFSQVNYFSPLTAMDTIATVHRLISHLKDSIQKSKSYEITRSVASKIEKKARVMETNSFFVREADMMKRNRTGRMDNYRFFLFSDHLIYAHASITGEYKVHGQLFLADMQVNELEDDPSGCAMYITHPTKSFVLAACNQEQKHEWLRDIYQSILACKRRQAQPERERSLSIEVRLEDQKIEQSIRSKFIKEALDEPIAEESETVEPLPRVASEPLVPGPIEITIQKEREIRSLSGTLLTSDIPSLPSSSTTAPSPPLSPSVSKVSSEEERAQKRKIDLAIFETTLTELAPKSIDSLFAGGVIFWKGLTGSRGGGLDKDQKARLQSLYRIATGNSSDPEFSSPEKPSSPRMEPEADLLEEDLTQEQAKISFLRLLFSFAPYWKYKHFI